MYITQPIKTGSSALLIPDASLFQLLIALNRILSRTPPITSYFFSFVSSQDTSMSCLTTSSRRMIDFKILWYVAESNIASSQNKLNTLLEHRFQNSSKSMASPVLVELGTVHSPLLEIAVSHLHSN